MILTALFDGYKCSPNIQSETMFRRKTLTAMNAAQMPIIYKRQNL